MQIEPLQSNQGGQNHCLHGESEQVRMLDKILKDVEIAYMQRSTAEMPVPLADLELLEIQ